MSVAALTWAFGQRGISDGAMVLLLVLADYADEDGVCWPSRRTLADRVGKSSDTVDRRVESLVDCGLVAVENRNRATAGGGIVPLANVYRLQLDRVGARGRRGRKSAATHTGINAAVGAGENAGSRKSADSRNLAATVRAPDAARVAAFSPPHKDKPPIEPPDSFVAPAGVRPTFEALRASDAALLAEAVRLAGDAVNLTCGATHHVADLRALIAPNGAPSSGPACDWALDVAPAIIAKAASCRRKGELIGSWTWIREGAVRLRDRRLQGLPEPKRVNLETADGAARDQRTTARERQARDSDAGMLAAARRRTAARAAPEPDGAGAIDAARCLAGPEGVREAG